MSELSIRPFEDCEHQYAALAQVESELFPDHPVTADTLRYDDHALDTTKFVLQRHMACLPQGDVVGHAVYHHMESLFHPQRFWLWIAVRPAWQRRGIGTALYNTALKDLQKHSARWLHTSARETMPHAVHYLQQRGFRETMRSWESHLDVQGFDPRPFQASKGRMQNEGVVFTTQAQEKTCRSTWLQELYELHTTLLGDVPFTAPYTPPSLDTFAQHNVYNPEALPDAYFIAKHNDRYIGESVLFRSQAQPESLYQGLTAVRREYRGRGIAVALKLATIDYAQCHGYKLIKTWNATVNTAMLSINDKLGFVRQPAWIELRLELPEEQ